MKPDIYPIKPDVYSINSGFQPININNPTEKSTAAQSTLISKGTTITGDITSDGDLEIYGGVKGTVSTTGNIKISGKQIGDVSGSSLMLESCTVRGNLTASEDINIDSDSVIIGDVKTKNLIIDGKLQGNVHAKSNITCQSNAIVIGDLVGASVSVKDGAKLQGKMQIFNGQLGEIKITDEAKVVPVTE
ncbi:MAG TPA: polymer-forming cytoskeletal protein [Caproiciproducens sp.]|nr:polymer-forming cytoskeletal protein [Caproiciproducens sp.]